MKRLLITALFLIGVVEIFYGLIGGPLSVYSSEGPFFRDLSSMPLTTEQYQIWRKYINIYKGQWHLVAVFGIATVCLAVGLYVADRKNKDA